MNDGVPGCVKNATTCKRSYVKFARTTSGCAASAIAYATCFKICTASAASTAVLRTPQARLPLLDNATLARPVHDGPRNTDPPQLVPEASSSKSKGKQPANDEEPGDWSEWSSSSDGDPVDRDKIEKAITRSRMRRSRTGRPPPAVGQMPSEDRPAIPNWPYDLMAPTDTDPRLASHWTSRLPNELAQPQQGPSWPAANKYGIRDQRGNTPPDLEHASTDHIPRQGVSIQDRAGWIRLSHVLFSVPGLYEYIVANGNYPCGTTSRRRATPALSPGSTFSKSLGGMPMWHYLPTANAFQPLADLGMEYLLTGAPPVPVIAPTTGQRRTHCGTSSDAPGMPATPVPHNTSDGNAPAPAVTIDNPVVDEDHEMADQSAVVPQEDEGIQSMLHRRRLTTPPSA
ncbi:hypothetical protein C8Q70DRAFT_937635 [Cubamyces menziesii]|nr:hypothetical protein C8Q70DRAFT_937635 [Cubamyces menziesii]